MQGALLSVGIGVILALCIAGALYLVHRLLGLEARRLRPVRSARIVRFVIIPIRCCVCGKPMADGELALAFGDGRFAHARCALTLDEVRAYHEDACKELDRLIDELGGQDG